MPTTRPDAGVRPVVVKLGGSTLGAHDTSLRDIAAAHNDGRKIVVVHGGGATVSAWLARAGVKATFVRGLRVTDAATLEVAVAVLAGVVNKQLVAKLAALGARAVGLSGADASILQARRYDDELGYVGRIDRVDTDVLEALLDAGYLPVVAPIAVDTAATDRGGLLNTNADTAAGAIAAAFSAEALVFLTDVDGVLDREGQLIAQATVDEARALLAVGVATGGMAPKLEAAIRAAESGCATHIIDGRVAGVVLRALAGAAVGTTIVQARASSGKYVR